MKKLLKSCVAVLATAAVCSTSIGLIGCGGDPDELILWWPSGKAYISIVNDAVERFKAENPGVKIKVQNKDIDAFDAYKFALNDDKTRPDVAIVDHVYVQALAQQNQLADLTAAGTDEIKELFPDALYNANVYDGKAYALPMSANTVVLMVNKDMLKECGIVDDAGNAKYPTTFDELVADCEIIKSKGKTAFAQPLNSFAVMEFASYVSRNGGAMVSDDGKKITFDNDGVVKALGNWKTMSKFANINTYEEDRFYNGKVAFVEMGSWSLPNVTGSSARFDCGFTEMVKIDGAEQNYSGLGLYSLCVARKNRNKGAAVKLAEFLATDSKVQLAFNKEKNLFPVTHETQNDEFYADNEAYKVFISQLQKCTPRPATPVWPDMEHALINMLREVVKSGSDDFTSIINTYQKTVQQASDRLYK